MNEINCDWDLETTFHINGNYINIFYPLLQQLVVEVWQQFSSNNVRVTFLEWLR